MILRAHCIYQENIWHWYLSLLMFLRNVLLLEGIYMSLKLNLKAHRLGFIAQNGSEDFIQYYD